MRTLVFVIRQAARHGLAAAPRLALLGSLIFSLGCAHDKAREPPPQTALDAVQTRACESCRHDLELCQKRESTSQASGGASTCMEQFMTCLTAQQLDSGTCSGVN